MGVTSVADFRDRGYTAEALVNYMTLWVGPAPKAWLERFAWRGRGGGLGFERSQRAESPLRLDKLNWPQQPGADERSPAGSVG